MSTLARVVTWAAFLCLASGPACSISDDEKRTAKADSPAPAAGSREFLFTYSAVVKGLTPGQKARVWLPVPPSNEQQHVETVRRELPGEPETAVEPKYGNQVLYLEAAAGKDGTVPLSLTYRVKRRELLRESRPGGGGEPVRREQPAGDAAARAKAEKAQEELFLLPDAKVPVGPRVKPMKLVEGRALPDEPLERARLFYDLVNAHMVYSKNGTGWGQGDADWACDSRFGNCSDFHSLFISLARSHGMPSKFEMGFPIPAKHGRGDVGGYHCWAFVKPGGAGRGWVPVDISEANKVPSLRDYYFGNLTPDRVAFTVGRDITLAPKQDGPPLNFFIYPYIESEGKPLPAEQVERKFTYEDVGAG